MDSPIIPKFDVCREFLNVHTDVEYIRYQWLDIGNILRTMILTRNYVLKCNGKPHKMSCLALAFLPHGDFNLSTFSPIGHDELWADWSSLRVCTYAGSGSNHASVMCFVKECSQNFPPWARDPRSILQRCLLRASREHNIEFSVGFELEFSLYDIVRDSQVIKEPYGARAFRNSKTLVVIEEIMTSLRDAGIEPLLFHSEGGTGQFEIPLSPLKALDAIDTLVFAKEAVLAIAEKHGIAASCYPKPLSKETNANGAHIHLSIDDGNDEMGNHFLAGLLTHLPALCAFSLPNFDSYTRLGDVRGTMGTWVGWGLENKDVAIRKIVDREAYWEIRTADQTANMYIALAAWIVAGCEGLTKGTPLAWKDPAGLVAFMPSEEMAKLGWTRKLPESLADSVAELKEVVARNDLENLGVDFLNMYIKYKELEIQQVKEKGIDERRIMYLERF